MGDILQFKARNDGNEVKTPVDDLIHSCLVAFNVYLQATTSPGADGSVHTTIWTNDHVYVLSKIGRAPDTVVT